MSYRFEKNTGDLVIDGWEKGISPSPYSGIANIRNVNTSYYPGVAYSNYQRKAATTQNGLDTNWYAGSHSTNVSNNSGWTFADSATYTMKNPVQHATSPAGINYILDDSGQIWKQSAANSSTFNILLNGSGRVGSGAGGLAYWNNYLIVFGATLIEICGDGTGDSGITSGNWNKATYSSAVVTSGAVSVGIANPNDVSTYSFNGSLLLGATSGTLAENWGEASGNYTIRFSNGDERVCTLTSGAATCTWTGGLSSDVTFAITMYQFTFSSSTGFSIFNSGDPVIFSSTGSLPTGITAFTPYYLTASVTPTSSIKIGLSATSGGKRFFPGSSSGTGTITMKNIQTNYPIKNQLSISFTWGSYAGASITATLPSVWLLPSGFYNIVDPLGNSILATFTYDSTAVTFVNPTILQPTGNYLVNILNPSATSYRAYVSKVDGNLYFTNGRWLGRIQNISNPNVSFTPGVPSTYSVNYAATGTIQPNDSIVDMVDLNRNLIILGNFDVYPWDYVSTQPNSSFPVGEQTFRIVNLLNNTYIFAGTKGNVYVSNGYSVQLLTKIPDYIAGTFDPIWSWGGVMIHRSKIWVQAMAKSFSGTNILAGIFSLLVSPSLLGEQANGLNMESQNSYGLTPATGALSNGILIDNEKWSSGVDSYYSAWSNGATTGGIDYNDTSLWQNFEPVIETDIIPIGTFFDKNTSGQLEFKLDRPMATGDQIKLYSKASLSDSYTQIGSTFTNLQLSDSAPSNIFQQQWVQFKIAYKCASSGSSSIPLRELRLHRT